MAYKVGSIGWIFLLICFLLIVCFKFTFVVIIPVTHMTANRHFNVHTPYYPTERTTIPSHFVWVQPMSQEDQDIPVDVKNNVKEWAETNPNFKIYLWTGKQVQKLFPSLSQLLTKIPNSSWISDILRYKIIFEYGGLYLDTDIRAYKSVEPLIRQFDSGFSVCEKHTFPRELVTTNCKIVGSAVVAAPQFDHRIKSVVDKSILVTKGELDKLRINRKHRKVTMIIGPTFFTNQILRFPSFKILHAVTFYLCSPKNRTKYIYDNFVNDEMVYGMHQWKKRW